MNQGGAADPGLEALIRRMRVGDREAAAAFLSEYGWRIRRRLRGKLGPEMRRVFDSQDLLSTLARRLDTCVYERKLAATSADEMWAFVMGVARNSILEKARVVRRLRAAEGEDTPVAEALRARLEPAREAGPGVALEEVLAAASEGPDRDILWLWLLGTPLAEIAAQIGMNEEAAKKRWQRLRARLRERFSDGRSE